MIFLIACSVYNSKQLNGYTVFGYFASCLIQTIHEVQIFFAALGYVQRFFFFRTKHYTEKLLKHDLHGGIFSNRAMNGKKNCSIIQ